MRAQLTVGSGMDRRWSGSGTKTMGGGQSLTGTGPFNPTIFRSFSLRGTTRLLSAHGWSNRRRYSSGDRCSNHLSRPKGHQSPGRWERYVLGARSLDASPREPRCGDNHLLESDLRNPPRRDAQRRGGLHSERMQYECSISTIPRSAESPSRVVWVLRPLLPPPARRSAPFLLPRCHAADHFLSKHVYDWLPPTQRRALVP